MNAAEFSAAAKSEIIRLVVETKTLVADEPPADSRRWVEAVIDQNAARYVDTMTPSAYAEALFNSSADSYPATAAEVEAFVAAKV